MNKTICIALFASLLSFCKGYTNLQIYNDSPYKLHATILSADGQNLGAMEIIPQHQMDWKSSYDNATTFSQTPYTVILRCPNGKEYGIWTEVPTGATITAQGSEGDKICPLPKKKDREIPGVTQEGSDLPRSPANPLSE